MTDTYLDIIGLAPRKSNARRQMSLHDRAAQFAPFAALSGYEDKIREQARLTDSRREVNSEEAARINLLLLKAAESPPGQMCVSVTYFMPDKRKSGGAYFEHSGAVRRVDTARRLLIFTDKTAVPIDDISAMSENNTKIPSDS